MKSKGLHLCGLPHREGRRYVGESDIRTKEDGIGRNADVVEVIISRRDASKYVGNRVLYFDCCGDVQSIGLFENSMASSTVVRNGQREIPDEVRADDRSAGRISEGTVDAGFGCKRNRRSTRERNRHGELSDRSRRSRRRAGEDTPDDVSRGRRQRRTGLRIVYTVVAD